jgi:SNF2 family DNA or RNA helicase
MTVYIEKFETPNGPRIFIRSPYSEVNRDRCKSIDGARWSKTAKAWTYPLDLEVCRDARRWFGSELQIGPELWAWSAAEKARAGELLHAARLDPTIQHPLPRVEAIAPKLAAAMYSRGYQTVAAKFGALAGSHLNADEMGLGKCVESLGAILEAGILGKVLVIAPPRALAGTWMDEIDKWLADATTPVMAVNATVYPKRDGSLRTATAAERHATIDDYLNQSLFAGLAFLFVNPEMLRIQRIRDEEDKVIAMELEYPELFEVEWDAIIADETHRYLLNVSQRSKSSSQVGIGFGKLKLAKDGMKVALSGSPFKGRRRNMWGTLNWLYPERYTSKWRWIGKYFRKAANPYSDFDYTEDFIDDYAEKEFNKELDRIMIRRTADELHSINPAWAPPPIQYYERWVDLGPVQRRQYNEMDRENTAEVEGGTLAANGILSLMTRLRQFASCAGEIVGGEFKPTLPSAKYDELRDLLAERGITGKPDLDSGDGKVIVASQFTSMIKIWYKALVESGINCLMITGETNIGETARIRDQFQTDSEHRVILLNTNAGGVSLTLDRADDVVIMDETWVPDDQSQVEFRARRASNVTHQVRVTYIRARDTFEEDIADTVAAKDWNQRRNLDGRRGVEWAVKHYNVKESAA